MYRADGQTPGWATSPAPHPANLLSDPAPALDPWRGRRAERVPMERIIRVDVCDAYDLVRSGVRLLLEQDPRIRVIDEARDDDEAIEKARRLFSRVVVIDTDRPDTVRALKGLSRDLYVVILSQSDDQAQVSALLRAGADAYLLKRSSPATLIQAIEGLADRQARIPVLDPRIVARSSRLHGL